MSRRFWFGFGAATFAVGLVAIVAMKRRDAPEGRGREDDAALPSTREEENHKVIHGLVVLTAGTAYLIMRSGGGQVRMEDGHNLYFMRYIDWSITTPLLLLGLGLVALENPMRRWGLLLGTLALDVYMIVTGFLSDASPRQSPMKWSWYAISSGAFGALYYLLWGPMLAEAETSGPDARDLYVKHTGFLSAVWAFYPLNFLLGPEGLDVIDEDSSTAVYTMLDITAKVIFGLYSLSSVQARADDRLARGEMPEHELRPAPAMHHEVWSRGPDRERPRRR